MYILLIGIQPFMDINVRIWEHAKCNFEKSLLSCLQYDHEQGALFMIAQNLIFYPHLPMVATVLPQIFSNLLRPETCVEHVKLLKLCLLYNINININYIEHYILFYDRRKEGYHL